MVTRFLLLALSIFLYSPFINAQTLPICESATSDSDGDGYGWENEQSCVVDTSQQGQCEDRGDFPWGWNPVTLSSCLLGIQTEPSECIDNDGDGFGWNGIATCIVELSQCEDRGGYPWGWNPVTLESCRLDEQVSTTLPLQPATECTDTDGDGVAGLTALTDSDISSGQVAINGVVYFVGTTSATGSEPAAYNPATGEVSIIDDIFSGQTSSLPSHFTALDEKLYFTARDIDTPQRDLWVYDPEAAAAPLRLNLFPNDFIAGDTVPGNLISFDGKIYLTADEFGIGNELMVYDPQTGVLEPASDINAGPASSNPGSLTEALGKLYFSADDGFNGRELWVFDPLTSESTMVTELSTNVNGSDPAGLFVIDDKIYYNTRSGGQTRVFDPQTGDRPSLLEFSVNGVLTSGQIIGATDNRLVLDFVDNARGSEPWIYDPQTDTTNLIADINPGPEGSRASGFVNLNGEIYFRAEAIFGEIELWVYNETTMDLRPFITPSRTDLEFPADLAVLDGRLYFVAGPASGPRDRKQWVYDPVCD